MKRSVSMCIATFLASNTTAQPADLVVDPAQSSISLNVTLDTALGAQTDSDSADLTGSMQIELDSYTSPSTITLIDYELNAGPLSFFFDYSFLGTVTATADDLSLAMPDGTPPVSGAVMPDGSFLVSGIPNETAGIINVSGTGAVGGAVGGTTVDLSTLTQTPIDISGTVNIDTGEVTLSVLLPIDSSGTDPDTGATVTLTGSTTVIAIGPVPEPDCPADTNGDGAVTPADFSAWVAAFNTMASECDQNGDNVCTPADFSAWVSNYNAGCN